MWFTLRDWRSTHLSLTVPLFVDRSIQTFMLKVARYPSLHSTVDWTVRWASELTSKRIRVFHLSLASRYCITVCCRVSSTTFSRITFGSASLSRSGSPRDHFTHKYRFRHAIQYWFLGKVLQSLSVWASTWYEPYLHIRFFGVSFWLGRYEVPTIWKSSFESLFYLVSNKDLIFSVSIWFMDTPFQCYSLIVVCECLHNFLWGLKDLLIFFDQAGQPQPQSWLMRCRRACVDT
jgi:hypothetical protein